MNKFVATAIALCLGAASLAVQAQTGGKKQFDPYSQGAKSGEKFDPYSQGAKAGDKFDPYSQGANKSTRSELTDASAPPPRKSRPRSPPRRRASKRPLRRRLPAEPQAPDETRLDGFFSSCPGAQAYGACVSLSSAVTSIRCTLSSWRTSVRSTKASAGQYQSVTCITVGSTCTTSSPTSTGPSEVRFS